MSKKWRPSTRPGGRNAGRYHEDLDCMYMKQANNPLEVDEETIERKGLTPCKECVLDGNFRGSSQPDRSAFDALKEAARRNQEREEAQ